MSETINFPEGFGSQVEYEYTEIYSEVQFKADAMVLGLREFAKWCAEHPEFVAEFIAPYWKDQGSVKLTHDIPTSFCPPSYYDEDGTWVYPGWRDRTPAEMAAEILRLRRLAGLTAKFAEDYYTGFYRDFGPVPGAVRLTIRMPRQVTCEMVDTGEVETYMERKVVTPAVIVEVPSTKPIMRRVCVDSLAALAHEEANS